MTGAVVTADEVEEHIARSRTRKKLAPFVRLITPELAIRVARSALLPSDVVWQRMTRLGERPRHKFRTPEHPIRPKPCAVVLAICGTLSHPNLAGRRAQHIVHRVTVRRKTTMQLLGPGIARCQASVVGRNRWPSEGHAARRVGGAKSTGHGRHRAAQSTSMLGQDKRRRRVGGSAPATEASPRSLEGKRIALKSVGELEKMPRQGGDTAGHATIVSGPPGPRRPAAFRRGVSEVRP